MPKIAVPEISRREFLKATPSLASTFMALVAAKSASTQKQQFIRTLPTSLKFLPAPKLAMGERVIHCYTVDDDLDCDNGLTVQNKGVVIGWWWNDPAVEAHQCGSDMDFSYHGWIYVIHYLDLPRERHFEEMRAPAFEDELQPWL